MNCLRILVGIFLFGCLTGSAAGQWPGDMKRRFPDERIRIKDVLSKVSEVFPDVVLGWEFGAKGGIFITDPAALLTAIEHKDLAAVGRLIAEQTDYECIIGAGTFVVVPKIDPEDGEIPLAEREMVYPDARDQASGTFLRTIKGADDNLGRTIITPPLMSPPGLSGPVTLPAGHCKSYELFAFLCRQLKAKSWIMIHSGTVDPVTHKAPPKTRYAIADVTFQETGIFNHWVE